MFVNIESTNIVLVLDGTNDIVANYFSDLVPPMYSIISIEKPKCSCKTGFHYDKYKIISEPRFSIMRYSVDTGHNDLFYQRIIIDVLPVDHPQSDI